MSTIFAAVDAGNGGVNAVVKKNNRLHTYYMPSARAAASGKTMGFADFESDFEIVTWAGNTYIFGEDALRARAGIESHIGTARYGNEFHASLVAVALAHCKIDRGNIDLTVLAPPGLYRDVKEGIIDRFSDKNARVRVDLSTDKKQRTWEYSAVHVVPEGLAAVLAMILDRNGKMVENDAVNGDILVLDGGMLTLDNVLIEHGNFNPETLQHATNTKAGIKAQVLNPVLRDLQSEHRDCRHFEVEHIDKVLRSGLEINDWSLEAGAVVIDTEGVFRHYFQRYAEYVANRIIDDQYQGLDGLRGAYLVGGWAEMVTPYLRNWYGSKILTIENVPDMKDVHPIDLNAVGALRYRLFQVKNSA